LLACRKAVQGITHGASSEAKAHSLKGKSDKRLSHYELHFEIKPSSLRIRELGNPPLQRVENRLFSRADQPTSDDKNLGRMSHLSRDTPLYPFGAGSNPSAFLFDELLIGICFLDAPRFRENWFRVGFIGGDFAPSRTVDKRYFRGFCKPALVLPPARCWEEGNGQKLRCWCPYRGAPHRRAQAASLHSAHWPGSVGQDVFVVGHGIHVVARFARPRPLRKGVKRKEKGSVLVNAYSTPFAPARADDWRRRGCPDAIAWPARRPTAPSPPAASPPASPSPRRLWDAHASVLPSSAGV